MKRLKAIRGALQVAGEPFTNQRQALGHQSLPRGTALKLMPTLSPAWNCLYSPIPQSHRTLVFVLEQTTIATNLTSAVADV